MKATINVFVEHLHLDSDKDALKTIEERLTNMAGALDDLKAANEQIKTAVTDVAARIKALADQVTGGVSATDAEAIVDQLKTEAAALEAAAGAPPPAGGPPA